LAQQDLGKIESIAFGTLAPSSQKCCRAAQQDVAKVATVGLKDFEIAIGLKDELLVKSSFSSQ
jgi:hypothetical protein